MSLNRYDCEHEMSYALLVFVGTVSIATGLHCITCEWSASIGECDSKGKTVRCMDHEPSCETVLRRNGNSLQISKGCKSRQACSLNQMQNARPSGISTQCNDDQSNSFCTCCCGSSGCNGGAVGPCAMIYNPANNCPSQPRFISHGSVSCTNSNRLGSVCRYRCTGPNYSLHPPSSEYNTCENTGSWSYETPCCKRPCPRFMVYDSAVVIHLSNPESFPLVDAIMEKISDRVTIGMDSMRMSVIFYGHEPLRESLIGYDEYSNNKSDMGRLLAEKWSIFTADDDNTVNTGAAIKYAIEYLYSGAIGSRGGRVAKKLTVITDANSSDDVTDAAVEARGRKILTYALAIAPPNGKLDQNILTTITGKKSRLFHVDKENLSEVVDSYLKEIASHICSGRC